MTRVVVCDCGYGVGSYRGEDAKDKMLTMDTYLKRIRQRDPQLNEVFKGGVQFAPPPPCAAF
jgi:hypothetical protein